MVEKLYYKYWGKAGSDDVQGNSYHLLPYSFERKTKNG